MGIHQDDACTNWPLALVERSQVAIETIVIAASTGGSQSQARGRAGLDYRPVRASSPAQPGRAAG